ncbi:MAG TPA: M48 family metalloprotease [Terriglobales bacterium]|jgi:predicted Zn-dependent protease|nr:M48 family metalloprotease [Terriglobales bacterium]
MRLRLTSLFVLFFLCVGVLPAKEPTVAPAVYNVLTDDDEAAFGRAAAADVAKSMPMLDDPVIDAYLVTVGSDLAKSSQRSNLTYHFRVVDSPQINSFSLPGGYIFVTRGLLDFVQNESELAGVLAHEISHIAARHNADEISRELIAAKLTTSGARIVGVNDETALKLMYGVGGPVAAFVQRPLRQEQEIEADRLAVYDVYRSGWNPQGQVTALERIKSYNGNAGLISLLTSNHPPVQVRIEAIKLEIAELPSTNTLINDSVFFQAAKARMLLLPAPKGK